MASRSHLDEDDDFGGDFPGANPNRVSGTKRSFGDIDDDEDDIFGSKKANIKVEETAPGVATGMILSLRESLQSCQDTLARCQSDLEAAKSEVQKWHSAFQKESFISAGSTVEPRVVINYLQNLKSSEESLREQLEKTKRKEAAFIVTIAKREQEIADLKIHELSMKLASQKSQNVKLRNHFEDAFAEEEMWRTQYGRAIHLDKEAIPDYPIVDLWDWAMVKEPRKSQKRRIRRLIGRLVKQSCKLHPSVPASGCLLKTAPICEVHLDLVRVRSGTVYRLRSPKTSYIFSLSSYDSLDPTKGWGFPELSMEEEVSQHNEMKMEEVYAEEVESAKDLSFSEKGKDHRYRDRAADRRSLHGGFGVGPGQKKSTDEIDSASSSPNPEEAYDIV